MVEPLLEHAPDVRLVRAFSPTPAGRRGSEPSLAICCGEPTSGHTRRAAIAPCCLSEFDPPAPSIRAATKARSAVALTPNQPPAALLTRGRGCHAQPWYGSGVNVVAVGLMLLDFSSVTVCYLAAFGFDVSALWTADVRCPPTPFPCLTTPH